MHIEIRCPNCFVEIDSDSIRIQEKQATCQECSTSFSFAKSIQLELRNKVNINQPSRFNVLKVGAIELDIQYKLQVKNNIATYLLLLLASRGIQFVIPVIFIGYILKIVSMDGLLFKPDFLIVLPIVFLITRLVKINNSIHSRIHIKNGKLSILNPVLKLNKSIQKETNKFLPEHTFQIDTKLIKQIFIEESQSRKGKTLDLFVLKFKLADDSEIKPIMPLFLLEEALYIEQEIEKFLHIKDLKMHNEYKS